MPAACGCRPLPQPFRPLPDWEFKDYLGWMEQGDGKLSYGVYIQVGWGWVGWFLSGGVDVGLV